MKRIEIVISPDGQTRLETKGFAGRSCQEASRFLERALGRSESDQRTSEFYRQRTDQAQHLEEG